MYVTRMQTDPGLRMWDQPILEGVRCSPRMNENTWTRALSEHADHLEFQLENWPFERCLGFSCACRGEEEEEVWSIPLTELKRFHKDVRSFYEAVRARQNAGGNLLGERRRTREILTNQAENRAIELLMRHLTTEQRHEFEARNCFHVKTEDKVYRIENGSHLNVVLVDDIGDSVKYCIVFKRHLHPHGRIPNGDLMLAQKLMLESNPNEFFRLARGLNLRKSNTEVENDQNIPGDPEIRIDYQVPLQALQIVEENGIRRIVGLRRAG